MSIYLYILRCADGSYYVGTCRQGIETRFGEHENGTYDGYTARRRPVTLVYSQEFQRIEDAIAAERQLKGWRREKKEALIRGDFGLLPSLSQRGRRSGYSNEKASFETRAAPAPQDKEGVRGSGD